MCTEMPSPLKDHFIYAIPTWLRMHGRTHPPHAYRDAARRQPPQAPCRIFRIRVCNISGVLLKSHQHTIKSRRRRKMIKNIIIQIRIYLLYCAPVLELQRLLCAATHLHTKNPMYLVLATYYRVQSVGGFCFLQASPNESGSIEMLLLLCFFLLSNTQVVWGWSLQFE